MKKAIQLLSLLALSSTHMSALAENNTPLCEEGSSTCTFVLLSEYAQSSETKKSNALMTINSKRANSQLSPFSTFKIANSLIALDKGLIKGVKQPLSFDKTKYPVQAWWPPVWKLPQYNLSTAFQYSMVAVYRQLASDIGQKPMQEYLTAMQYGNQDMSSGLDDFWLNKSMKISANEQVSFLQKLYHNQFNFKDSAVDMLKSVMLTEENEHYKLYAKTGAGKVDDGTMLGWYVGFVENDSGVHYFAFNFNRDSYAKMKADRIQIAKNHLEKAGVIAR